MKQENREKQKQREKEEKVNNSKEQPSREDDQRLITNYNNN